MPVSSLNTNYKQLSVTWQLNMTQHKSVAVRHNKMQWLTYIFFLVNSLSLNDFFLMPLFPFAANIFLPI